LLIVLCLTSAAFAQCGKDERSDEHGGLLVTDFTIVGTNSLTSTELAQVAGDFIGSCFDNDTEEMKDRLRDKFQNRGYFAVEVKSLGFKPRDPLGIPKPVTVEAEVEEGLKYKVAEIIFLENHAFSSQRLLAAFPLKKGAFFARNKVGSGLENVHALYASSGFLDSTYLPDVESSSNGTVTLKVTVDEGPMYHMGKLEIVAPKDTEARLRTEWKMAEGSIYDSTYVRKFIEKNESLLPSDFTEGEVQQVLNCPETRVDVSFVIDPRAATSEPLKRISCEKK
jgi:outer membrane protein assembly factor BamA